MRTKIVAIVQARAGSARLPAKVLADIAGRPLLSHVLRRTARARCVDAIVLATSDQPQDNPVAALGEEAQRSLHVPVSVFRGAEADVLLRYRLAAEQAGATRVVRITGDCPLIDWDTIDALIEAFEAAKLDYMGAGPSSGFPRGLDCEILSIETLIEADRDALDPRDREHVTRFVYSHPERFRCATMDAPADLHRTGYRLCVDEAPDLDLVRSIYHELASPDPIPIADVIRLLDNRPDLRRTNAGVAQKHS